MQSRIFLPHHSGPHDHSTHYQCHSHDPPKASWVTTHALFFSIFGLLPNSPNSNPLINTNSITLISARANLYPIQFLAPPRKVMMLPQVPGTRFCSALSFSSTLPSEDGRWRDGLKDLASGPQILSEVFILAIAEEISQVHLGPPRPGFGLKRSRVQSGRVSVGQTHAGTTQYPWKP